MFLQINLFSQALASNTTVNVFIPSNEADTVISGMPGTFCENGARYQALYLLHGAYDDNSMWPLCTNIRRYAQERKLAVIMPSANNSIYQDMEYGGKYCTFITEELPKLMSSYFCIAAKPENTFIAGNSMGGYGAVYLALKHPGQYRAAISFSGALKIESLLAGSLNELQNSVMNPVAVFGTDLKKVLDSDANLQLQARRRMEQKAVLPPLYMVCGTEDFLIEDNRKAAAEFKELGMNVTYTERPGQHGWPFWEANLEKALDWLPLARKEVFEK